MSDGVSELFILIPRELFHPKTLLASLPTRSVLFSYVPIIAPAHSAVNVAGLDPHTKHVLRCLADTDGDYMPRKPRIVTKKLPNSSKVAPAKFKQASRNTIWYFEGDLSSWLGPIVTNPHFTMRDVALATVIGENFEYNGRARTNLIKFDEKAIADKIAKDKKLHNAGVRASKKELRSILEKLKDNGHIELCCHERKLYYFTDPTK